MIGSLSRSPDPPLPTAAAQIATRWFYRIKSQRQVSHLALFLKSQLSSQRFPEQYRPLLPCLRHVHFYFSNARIKPFYKFRMIKSAFFSNRDNQIEFPLFDGVINKLNVLQIHPPGKYHKTAQILRYLDKALWNKNMTSARSSTGSDPIRLLPR